jgi:sugar phosphate permease
MGSLLMGMLIGSFLIYWLVAFVGCFTIVEIAQDQLYDQVTPHAGLKVSAASAVLAALMTYFHPSFESMFTTSILNTIFQGIVWFAVFTLILQFHPWHALGLGVLTMLLISGLATMGVDGMLQPKPQVVSTPASAVNKPVRGTLTPAPAKTK